MKPACPVCGRQPQLLPGHVAFMDDFAAHDREWLICWERERRAERPKAGAEPVWLSFSDPVPDSQEITWKKHTQWHWQTKLNGELLDYWPSTNKFRYRNVTHTGDVAWFIEKNRGKG